MTTTDPTFDLARAMPWAWAEDESWWLVTGAVSDRHTFSDCIARVLPQMVTGSEVPVFEVLVYGNPLIVGAEKITTAKRLIFVLADDPATPLYTDDADFLRATDSCATAWPDGTPGAITQPPDKGDHSTVGGTS